jgi:dTDP-4-dehydrorhamnose reductase
MLGSEVAAVLQAEGLPFLESDVEVDITDWGAVSHFAESQPLGWIVNCAAYTAVDKAEEEPERAFALNQDGPTNLARLCASRGARLLHVSTDYVFDGEKTGPYHENDVPNPRGVYGQSKRAGEDAVRSQLPEAHVILRTAWLFGRHGKNFVSTMLRLMKERDELRVVNDQHGCPTFAVDLARAIVRLVTFHPGGATTGQTAGGPAGTYHFCNAGPTSWHAFASEIYRRARSLGLVGSDCRIEGIPSSEYPTAAPRPANSVLDTSRIRREMGMHIRHWKDALSDYLWSLAEAGSVFNPQEVGDR